MPELPEVETTVRGLRRVLDGRRLTRVDLHRDDLRRAFPDGLVQRLVGATITGLSRRAKYGLIATDRDDTLIFHLGMSGRMRLDPEVLEKHDHVVFHTDDGHVVAFNDARRFGSLDLVPTAALGEYPALAALGPEPLGVDLTAHLKAAFKDRIAPVKALLLDQRVVAGLGNIYVCEALNCARIHPAREGGKISAARIAALADAIPRVLDDAIAAGGSTLRDFAQVDGTLGYFQKSFRVYGREGEPCPRDGHPIKRIVQSGRSSFFCSWCQR
ncbi:bifunctional DNA-formamidopyrimidine glycosylase/DNA-(apurinic or apyrimidinic site) lyase [Glacieibacterium sp.]|uniref:bifunctional DNA-formamidopyrimidine glycosylase/DNA-(apurinic or apyrimidinic site) lyase n=1 Tax=Glacieibacterium sp. TaxID=2860237 RepID=UPI003B008DAC